MHWLIVMFPGIFLLGAGFIVILLGIFASREGTNPYCCRCRRRLADEIPDACPHCRLPLNDDRIERGEPVVRKSYVVIGTLLFLIGASPFILTFLDPLELPPGALNPPAATQPADGR